MNKKLFFFTFIISILVNNMNSQINGSLFKWQGNISNSWSNSLNWQVWDNGTSSWVTNSTGTFPNSTTHTVTVDYASATTKTVALDVSSGNADVGQLFLINNSASAVQFKFNSNTSLSVYNTFSVSGTNTNSITISCASSGSTFYEPSQFGGAMSGGGFIAFKPAISTTITPIFANSTYTNVGIGFNGLGTTNIVENNLTFQGALHQGTSI